MESFVDFSLRVHHPARFFWKARRGSQVWRLVYCEFPKTPREVLSHGALCFRFCNWIEARRVHAFAGMLAVSTDQILPNSVGDLALTQHCGGGGGERLSVFLDASALGLCKKYSLFLPQKRGSRRQSEPYPTFPLHCLPILGDSRHYPQMQKYRKIF